MVRESTGHPCRAPTPTPREDYEQALDWLVEGKAGIGELPPVLPLEEGPGAFADLVKGPSVADKGLSGGVRGVNAPEGALSGKTALVIGASSGIGLETAKLFRRCRSERPRRRPSPRRHRRGRGRAIRDGPRTGYLRRRGCQANGRGGDRGIRVV